MTDQASTEDQLLVTEAESVAVLGASARPGSFGDRVLTELRRSASSPQIFLVNPRYDEIAGLPCYDSLDEIPEPVDLVLMCVGDSVLSIELERAVSRGDRSAVIFGSAVADPRHTAEFRQHLADIARNGGIEVCGAGCMGFVNVARGLRAIGYLEPDPLPPGPIALITHSGSAF